MGFIEENLIATMLVIGFALLAIEVLILGFSTFILFFVGIAAIVTGVLFFIGLMPESILNAFLSTAILSTLLAVVLWQPLKNMQQKTDDTKAKSDLIGLELDLTDDLTPGQPYSYRYSGIDWQLKCKVPISSGSRVKVTDVEVGAMHISPAD